MHRRRLLWQCKDCAQQTSATAGTVMHGTHTPLRTWFWAAYLVATHHPGISAKQLQRQLGLSRYETAWLILQKLRRAMVAPERELLKGEVEIDEFWLGGYEEGLKGSCQRGKRRSSGSRSRSAEPARGACAWRRYPTPPGRRYATSPSPPPSKARSSTQTGCSPTASWPSTATTTDAGPREPPRLASSSCRAPIERVRLSPQPSRHSDGSIPDPPRARRRPPTHDLPPDHPPSRLNPNGINRIRTSQLDSEHARPHCR